MVYLRSFRRRPVRLHAGIFAEDVQGSIPFGWCEGCGMECYEPDSLLCPECLRKETEYEKDQLSLHTLHPGTESPAMRK